MALLKVPGKPLEAVMVAWYSLTQEIELPN